MKITVCLNMTPYLEVLIYQHFGRIYCILSSGNRFHERLVNFYHTTCTHISEDTVIHVFLRLYPKDQANLM